MSGPLLDRLRRLPRPLLALYAGTLATRVGAFVVPYLTLYLVDARELSLAATGRVIALGSVGLLAGNIGGGWLADRVGRKPTLLLALGINAIGIGSVATSLPSGLAYAVALAVALGGAGMYTPAANALIADLTTDEERPLAYTVNYVGINVGMGLGPLLGGLLAGASFRWLFVVDIATTVCCAIVIALGVPAVKRTAASDASPRGSVLSAWCAHPHVLAFCGAGLLLVAPLMGLEFAVPLLVGRVFEAPLVFVGTVYTINAASILVLSFSVERLVRGRSPTAMMAVAGVAWTAGMLVLAAGRSVTALLACTAIWTVGEIIGSVVVPTYVSRRARPDAKARLLAVPDAVRSLCAIACPAGLGLVWDGVGVDAVFGILVALPLAGVVVFGLAWFLGQGRAAPRAEVV